MLCRSCHIHVRRDFPYCLRCGTVRKGASVAEFEAPSLVFRVVSNGMREQRFRIEGATTTIGRDADNDVVLDDSSVSRHHATITRTGTGYVVADHGSRNGTTITPPLGAEVEVRAEPMALADHTTVHVGDVAVLFDQPRGAAIAGRTQVKDIAGTVLGKTADGDDEPPPATEPLDATPRRRSGWALKETAPGAWVLRNTRTNAYLQLDERDVFLWNRLDGENSMRDLLFAYLEEFGELALPRIESTVRSLHEAGLVRGLPGDVEETTFWRRLGRAVVKNLIRVELSVKNLDPMVEKLYHSFAWRFFTGPAVVLLWLLTLAGLGAFVVASGEKQLFDFGGAGVVGLVAAAAGYVVATTIHEFAHALAVKSYGRRVNRGGFLLMMGMPFAFVDTSDMWFGTSWSRIVVAVSGPLTTVGLAGAASIAAVTVPDPVAAGICFTLAAGLYLNTLFNLIPLIPLDGYQALADALRMPRLKEEAKAYFSGGLLGDLRAGRRPGAKQVGLLVFALLSVVCLWGMLAMSALTWNSRLGNLARDHVPQPWLTVLVVAALLVLLFPVWYGRVRTLVRKVRARRSRATPRATPQASEASLLASSDREAPSSIEPDIAGRPEDAPVHDHRAPIGVPAPSEAPSVPVDHTAPAPAPGAAPAPVATPTPAASSPGDRVTTPVAPDRAVEIVAGVADVVEVAHRLGRVHGNVRLAAVRVHPDGTVDLADAPPTSTTSSDDLDHTAPEVFDGEPGPAADVYALGVLLHQLLTGGRPFAVTGLPALMKAHLTAPPPRPSATSGVPGGFDEVIAGAMAKDPAERYATVAALVAAARSSLPARPTTVPAPGTTPGPQLAPAVGNTDATFIPRHARSARTTAETYVPGRGRTDTTHVPRRARPAPTDSAYVPER